MKLRLIILTLLIFTANFLFAQGDPGGIDGKILNDRGEAVPFASIGAFEGGALKGQAKSDINGNYKIKPLGAGVYTLQVSSVGYDKQEIQNVQVSSGRQTALNITMQKKGGTGTVTKTVTVTATKLVDPNKIGSNVKGTDEMQKIAGNDIGTTLATMPGVNASSTSGVSIGGERADGTMVIVDGIMTRGTGALSNLPPDVVRNIEVFRTGLPAKYGNATGGVISVNTLGISRELRGGFRAETSVDGYFNNFAAFNLSGPLAFKKDNVTGRKIRPVLGFLLSLSGKYNKDGSPGIGGFQLLDKDLLADIQETPLQANPFGTGTASYIRRTETVSPDDFRTSKARENAQNYSFNYLGKLDFSPTPTMNVSIGTYFDYGRAKAWSLGNSLYSPEANAINQSYQARGFVRLQQSLGKASDDNPNPVFSNAYYTLQLSYQRGYSQSENADHGRNIFDYGYVGKFDQKTAPQYIQDTAKGGYLGWKFLGDAFVDLDYTPGGVNPLLENYTEQIFNDPRFDLSNTTTLQVFGGLINGQGPSSAYGLFTGSGAQVNGYSYSQADQFNLNLDASFDLNQGTKNAANKDPITHQIEFGLGYEQITSRSYSLSASSLWTQARLSTNRHIQNLDLDNPIFVVGGQEYTFDQVQNGQVSFSQFDTIKYNNFYSAKDQSRFDKELRKKLFGNEQDLTRIFTDNLDPSTFTLDMFSAADLLNNGASRVAYNGYDYLGNIERNQPSFNDFWTKKDERGDLLRPIAPYNPNYLYGYLSDKFRFRDIQFNVGVRIDRFDANQSVLRDPYSLYGVRKLESLQDANYKLARNSTTNTTAPDPFSNNFDKDWVAYVDNNQASTPTLVGYRKGDVWYDPFGKEAPDPTVLSELYANGLPIQPWFQDANDSIKSENYKIDNAFTDYKPDIAVSPRVQFAFPITDQALFYGNYDIVTQYPQGSNFVTPDDYYYLGERGTVINNANLQMQRTINYTLGFEQALTDKSKIGLEAFYNERKDQIQLQQYIQAFPQTYLSYGNRDYSSTKGFVFNYKLIPTQDIPLRVSIAYTLQFAEGTGSNSTSTSTLIASGQPNLRTIFPLNFDRRHNANINLDYRFAPNYSKGPKLGDHYIFSGVGLNAIFTVGSGEPFTRAQLARPLGQNSGLIIGGINGSRKPWTTDLGLRLDKDFILARTGRKKDEDGKIIKNSGKALQMNVYAYTQNTLNTKNIVNVYGFTSLPDDDGYLASAQGQRELAVTQRFPESYEQLYNIQMANPYNYSNPRRIYVGFIMNF